MVKTMSQWARGEQTTGGQTMKRSRVAAGICFTAIVVISLYSAYVTNGVILSNTPTPVPLAHTLEFSDLQVVKLAGSFQCGILFELFSSKHSCKTKLIGIQAYQLP